MNLGLSVHEPSLNPSAGLDKTLSVMLYTGSVWGHYGAAIGWIDAAVLDAALADAVVGVPA